MKKFIALAASSVVLFAAATTFAATQTANLGVGANVPQRCSISATGLNFSIQATTTTTNAMGNITVTCQGSTSYSIGIDNGRNESYVSNSNPTLNDIPQGDRNLADLKGNKIPYDVYHDAAHQNKWGNTAGTSGNRASSTDTGKSFPVYAKISSADTAEPGSYSDQLTVTLYY